MRVAWLSLDAGDSDPARFLAYLVAALQTISAGIGAGVMAALESPPPPATEPLLTVLLNEIAALRQEFIFVLDDYHLVDAKPVDQALTFLLEHQPPQMRLVIATREDPPLPLARLLEAVCDPLRSPPCTPLKKPSASGATIDNILPSLL